MTPLSLRQLRHAVGGRALTVIPDESLTVSSVCIDSRQMTPGAVFIAIRGDAFDGHRFLVEAAAKGAAALIVSAAPADPPAGVPIIQTTDTRVALGRLARHVRQQFRGKVIAVAGSNGKTSTKHLIHAALRGRLKGQISPKSFNNDIGVPLTILPAEPSLDYLVLEIGTNHHGEIKPLSTMSQPDIAVITNCGAEHLEGLGDLAGVCRENAQITSGLNPRGVLIVNGDDETLLSAVREWPGKKFTFGFRESNDLFAADVKCTPRGTEFSLNKRPQRVFVPMLGRHAAANALAAIAVARAMRLPEEAAVESLAASDSPEMRLQLQSAGPIDILNDAYNANPNSMQSALETLAALEPRGRRVAILGDMRELGAEAEHYHREIGQLIARQKKVDVLLCVGPLAAHIADAATAGGFSPAAVHCFADADQAASAAGLMLAGDMVLLKGSRAMKLERVATALQAMAPAPVQI